VIKDDVPGYLERLRLDDPRTELGLEALLSESNETLTWSISESEAEARRFFKGLMVGAGLSLPIWIGIGIVVYRTFWR
jgi:hypothetical protein